MLERNDQFRGCAGSGFNDWELRKFKDLFSDAQRIPNPYSSEQVGEPYTAARLKTQVLVKFYQVTDAGVMRFPIFINSNSFPFSIWGETVIYPLMECPQCHEKKMKLCPVIESDTLQVPRRKQYVGKLGVKCKACGYTAVLTEE